MRVIKKGNKTRWLIHTGTHGDEFEVIDLVKKYIEKNKSRLPDFLWIPEVSPSAVALKTRKNIRGLDVNRNFFDDCDDAEVESNLKIIKNKKFEIFISFHEDLTTDKFYLYDSEDFSKSSALKNLYQKIADLGVEFYDGLDDPNLGNIVKNGYVIEDSKDGQISVYIYKNKIANRVLIPEIPGKASPATKDKIVECLFEYLLSINSNALP